MTLRGYPLAPVSKAPSAPAKPGRIPRPPVAVARASNPRPRQGR